MPTNTYVELDKVTVGTATSTVTFSSIPSGYTDLVIVFSGNASAITNSFMRFNSDTGSNYSMTWMAGTGSAAASGRETSQTRLLIDVYGYANPSNITNKIINVQNYSNTTTFKTVLGRANNSAAGTDALVGLWRSTSAITQIDILTLSATTFSVGSTFSLYGIKAWAAETTPKATGGYVYEDSNYWYHSFPFSGTFTPNQSLNVDYLVVAGGGSGCGGYYGGGGGAGGYRTGTSLSVTATNYAITVGAGGAGNNTAGNYFANNGNDSVFSTITSTGGGGGGNENTNWSGRNGGSGGGAQSTGSVGLGNTPSTSPSQGNNGGTGINKGAAGAAAGGGGGASAVGGNASNAVGGTGGAGSNSLSSWATVTSTGVNGYYAGGGGGGVTDNGTGRAAGGTGGGGLGGWRDNFGGSDGVASTGSGGGGAGGGATTALLTGGNGGSGIVIVRYAK